MNDTLHSNNVYVARQAGAAYPSIDRSPFHPTTRYPEYSGALGSGAPNLAYELVRQTLAGLGLDAARFGQPTWNPIGDLVPQGSKIVLKPNWVLHRNEGNGGTDCLVTHASVLRAILDYVWLNRPREVIVGDAPLQGCDLDALLRLGFDRVRDHFATEGKTLRVQDFRRTILVRSPNRIDVAEDLRPIDEYVLVDLGADSLLEPVSQHADRFRVTMYDPRKMRLNHRPGVHRYLIARDILTADLVINLPKLKTHQKAGMSGALKNLVGINGNKDFLPHHRKGSLRKGGDNYEHPTVAKRLAESVLDLANRHLHWPRFYAGSVRMASGLLRADSMRGLPADIEGGWHGNDTVWRMCLDLNSAFLYADARGQLHDTPQRQALMLTDALIAGEGNGPLCPDPHSLGALIGARNAAAHDWVAAALMGFVPQRIPLVAHAFDARRRPLAAFKAADIACVINGVRHSADQLPDDLADSFVLPERWRGHCEKNVR